MGNVIAANQIPGHAAGEKDLTSTHGTTTLKTNTTNNTTATARQISP